MNSLSFVRPITSKTKHNALIMKRPERLWQPYLPKNVADPYPMYDRLRADGYLHQDVTGSWIATSYEAVRFLLTDEHFKTKIPDHKFNIDQAYTKSVMDAWILLREGKVHKRLRGVAKNVIDWQGIESTVQEVVDQNLEPLKTRSAIDAVTDIALLTPTRIITRILGLPIEDAPRCKAWAGVLLWAVNPYITPQKLKLVEQNAHEFAMYLDGILDQCEKERPDSTIARLLKTPDEEGNYMTREEVISFVIFLYTSGEETVVNFIGSAIYALLKAPDKMAALAADLSLINIATEELLRLEASLQYTVRFADVDIELEGAKIQKGDMMVAVIGAANHDPQVFENPRQLNFNRKKYNHLTFGVGRHYCFGARLARIEARAVLEGFAKNLSHFKLDENASLKQSPNIMLRGFQHLPLIAK